MLHHQYQQEPHRVRGSNVGNGGYHLQRGTDATSSVRLRRDKRQKQDDAAAANAVAAAAVAAQRKSNRHSGDFLLWSNHKVCFKVS